MSVNLAFSSRAFSEINYQKKISYYSEKIEKEPNNAWNYYFRGNAYISINKYDYAKKDFKKSISIDKSFKLAYTSLSRVYIDEKNYNKALKILKEASRLNLESKYLHYLKAICYDNTDKPFKAIGEYTLFLNSSPKVWMNKEYYLALKNRARLYFIIGKYRQSIDDINLLMDDNKTNPELLYFRAASFFKLGYNEKAIDDLENNIDKYPKYGSSYFLLAIIYAKKNNKEKTEYYLVNALKNGVKEPNAFLSISDIVNLIGKERIKEYIQEYKQ